VLAGGVGTWNQALDSEFAFNTLLAQGSGLQIVNITNPLANLGIAETVLAGAQATPQGQARIALGAALADTPRWFDPLSPEPAPEDYATREFNQFLWLQQIDFPFAFAFRAELEFRAHGNPSWNTGVSYKQQLERSVDFAEVQALYQQAGLSLDDDLQALDRAARMAAKPAAGGYLSRNIIFNGQISGSGSQFAGKSGRLRRSPKCDPVVPPISLSLDQRVRTRRAPNLVRLRVRNPPPRLRKVNLLLVRSEEEVVGRVAHELSLTHGAGAGRNSTAGSVQTLDEGGFEQKVTARGPLRVPD